MDNPSAINTSMVNIDVFVTCGFVVIQSNFADHIMLGLFKFIKNKPSTNYQTWFKRSISNTIFALSSGYGKCGVAIIRVSGPRARRAIEFLVKADPKIKVELIRPSSNEIYPNYASYRRIWHPNTAELIDQGIILWFPAPKSFTGEDCCEFQVHGSSAVITAMLDALNSIDGFRPALPGEFTRRAFRSNKLDLTQVEGLADLLNAETDVQRIQALSQLNGHMTRTYDKWRRTILNSLANLEAYIDFGEDENIEADTITTVHKNVDQLIKDIENFLNDSRKGEMRRTGIKAVILGEPNVGKSSFMNHICKRPISIVANVEGTTRDVIESSFNIAGFPVILADTAGLRGHTSDEIEKEGINRAKNYAADADLIILIVDANQFCQSTLSLDDFKRDYLTRIGITDNENIYNKEMVIIANKKDLIQTIRTRKHDKDDDLVLVSCTQSEGIEEALNQIEKTLRSLTGYDKDWLRMMDAPNERHRLFIQKCVESLTKFHDYTKIENFDFSIAALHLRESLQQLDNIVGRTVDNEEMYDVIFKEFCIGK